ncbi:MAG: RluA family pseudouridine synthase [Acholeplasmatales bacterium]|nr:RluA family pseudouridine synthase [Acholeplasmatales bacterium]
MKNTRNNKKELDNKIEKIEFTAVYKVRNSTELLTFLLEKTNQSRNNVKNLLTRHQVLVNGVVITQYNYLLSREDEVKISKRSINEAKPIKKKEFRPKFEILYEDEDLIAINKPSGLLSVESDKDRNSAYKLVNEYLQSKNKNDRCYIVHRIDKETSGVLIFAKNRKIHSIWRLKWNDFVSTREYYAVVEGKMKDKSGQIKSYLKENQYNLMYSTLDRSGELAITNYEVVSTNGDYSLLRVLIDTGRKNQIRVHMHEMGNPIVGDEKYGFNKNPLKRLGLHASVLEIKNPLNGRLMRFEAKCPKEFKDVTR